jgi:flagellar protein FlaG
MTTEINALVTSLRPPSQEQPASNVVRRPEGQQVAAARRANVSQHAGEAQGEGIWRQGKRALAEDEGAVEETVSDLNVLVQKMRRELQFTVEQDSGEVVVKIIDTETDKVVRQIPPEELVELKKRLSDAAGAIFRETV